jgi:signal transduction histidine kinase
MRRRFFRGAAVALAVFFVLTVAANVLAVALLSNVFGLGAHRQLAPFAAILGVGLLVAFVATGRAVRRMARPLAEVMEAADQVAGGDYSARVEARGSREMRGLARSFNAMAERLAASEAQRRDLLADLAHELRTPLSVIQGHVEGILDGLYAPDPAHLDPVLEETRVMARLLDDLRTLSTAEAGVLRLHRQAVEPDQLVSDAVAAFRSRADGAGVRLEGRTVPDLDPIEVDPVRIGEVLSNLLLNAVRHTPSGGSVTVAAGRADGGIAFSVRDTGTGIPPDVLPHVFDRFVKAADTGGAGLGLAIAKSLVEAHGGEITAESSPGNGTTMRFVLPPR